MKVVHVRKWLLIKAWMKVDVLDHSAIVDTPLLIIHLRPLHTIEYAPFKKLRGLIMVHSMNKQAQQHSE